MERDRRARPAVAADGAAGVRIAFDVATDPGHTNLELLGDSPEMQPILELLGRDLVTKVLVQTPQLSVYHETAEPGERVKAHRHGVYQVDYVLRGELRFGSQRVTPGMGYFIPTGSTRGRPEMRAPSGSRSTQASAESTPIRRPGGPDQRLMCLAVALDIGVSRRPGRGTYRGARHCGHVRW